MGTTNSTPAKTVPVGASIDTSGIGSGSFMESRVKEWEAEKRGEAMIGASCECGGEEEESVENPSPSTKKAAYMASSVDEWERNLKA